MPTPPEEDPRDTTVIHSLRCLHCGGPTVAPLKEPIYAAEAGIVCLSCNVMFLEPGVRVSIPRDGLLATSPTIEVDLLKDRRRMQ